MAPGTDLTAPRTQVLALVMQHLQSAKDLVCLGSTCKVLRTAVRDLRATVRLAESLNLQEEDTHPLGAQLYSSKIAFTSRKGLPSHVPPSTVEVHLSQVLVSLPGVWALIPATFCATAHNPPYVPTMITNLNEGSTFLQLSGSAGILHLDVSNTLCLDSHIALAASQLKHLVTLTANHCRKLTSQVSSVVFDKQLQHVCLQRCFQLTKDTLLQGLHSGRMENSSILTLTFSHLDLRASSHVACTPLRAGMPPQLPSSLQTLALHCCEGLSPAFFGYLATLAPNLKALLLGGSTVSSRACMQSMQPGSPSYRPVMASSQAEEGIAAAESCKLNSKADDNAIAESDAPPRFESVLSFVCRVREDMLLSLIHI